MKNPEFEKLEDRLNKIEEELEENSKEIDWNECQEKVYKLEEDINTQIDMCFDDTQEDLFRQLLKRTKRIKEENDFFDEYVELGGILPDGDDPDSIDLDC